jgi:hypothetical protein
LNPSQSVSTCEQSKTGPDNDLVLLSGMEECRQLIACFRGTGTVMLSFVSNLFPELINAAFAITLSYALNVLALDLTHLLVLP